MELPIATEDAWRRSSKCSVGACVEVRFTDSCVLIRDSKQNHLQAQQSHISIDHDTWRIFVAELLDKTPSGSNGVLVARDLPHGWIELCDTTTSVTLTYDLEEWAALIAGLHLGELLPPLAA